MEIDAEHLESEPGRLTTLRIARSFKSRARSTGGVPTTKISCYRIRSTIRPFPVRVSRAFFRAIPLAFALLSHLPAAAPPSNEWLALLEEPSAIERFPGRIEQTRAASEPYRQHLRAVQQNMRTQMEAMHVTVTGAVQHLMNGMFVRATPDQAAALRTLSGVKAVVPLRRYQKTDQLMMSKVQQAWASAAIGGQSNAGKGLKIGIIDTGIDQTHPSFQDSSLSPPAGFPKCDVPSNCAFTSGKVIVARSYVSTLTAGSNPSDPAADSRPDDVSARDLDGHGTAVASVAAGVPVTVGAISMSGVAPKAYLGNYKIFGSPEVNNGASGSGMIQALDDAVTDGMDVVNLSSGGPAFGSPLDTGAVCLAEREPIRPDETAGELHDRLAVVGAALMVRALRDLEQGALACWPQHDEGTYATKIETRERRIDWSRPAREVHNLIRGLSPHPGAWFEIELNGKRERVRALRSILSEGEGKPGTVLDNQLTIACDESAVRLTEVQRAGKRAMPAEEFLRGATLRPRTILN